VGMVAFFPWLKLKDELAGGGFKLIQFERGRLPGGADQERLDRVLQPYIESRDRPIEKATILVLDGHGPCDDLTANERSTAFEFAEILKVAGLSARKFDPFGYVNSTVFTLYVQGFNESTGTVAIGTRQRFGLRGVAITPGAYQVQEPHNAIGYSPAPVDLNLVGALLAARDSAEWERISRAITLFNAANTDNDTVSARSELVETVSAMEALLEVYGQVRLAMAVLRLWPKSTLSYGQVRSAIDTAHSPRWPAVRGWVQDLYGARNASAHALGPRTTTWSADEHLLFAAFMFPLLLKRVLARETLYELTADDESLAETFEVLLKTEPFAERAITDDHPWKAILHDAGWNAVTKRAIFEVLGKQIEDALDGPEFGVIPGQVEEKGPNSGE